MKEYRPTDNILSQRGQIRHEKEFALRGASILLSISFKKIKISNKNMSPVSSKEEECSVSVIYQETLSVQFSPEIEHSSSSAALTFDEDFYIGFTDLWS
ncbi:hypothetical protein H5410_006201 [Solanum commersonii]|uniref:Uncharacterized protein n=1 Tax=Solanum commersonii TaxID=4109 RepID=A0A9J6AAL6_SOLCO|nr:hypothetical protein H5410_006201 [Solanum commersonii]